MRQAPQVRITKAAREAAAAKVRDRRARRAKERRAARPELAARLDRLTGELALARSRAAKAQANLGPVIRAAMARTLEDEARGKPEAPIATLDASLRPARFILEAAKPIDPCEALEIVLKALGLQRSPDAARIDLVFPKLSKRRPALARFLILELKANRRSLSRARGRIADRLRRAGPFVSARAEALAMSMFSGGGTGQGYEMAEPGDRDWHLTSPNDDGVDFRGWRGAIDVYGAWEILGVGPDGADAGRDIRIGHPDSGFREHDDYPPSQIDLPNAYNAFLDATTPANAVADPSANLARHGLTPLTFPYFVQHGTYTASTIVAPRAGEDDEMVGVAPGATMVPLRCVDTVVLAGDMEVTLAIEHALTVGVDVISISLGGAPNPALREALAAAVEENVIVVAAAGQPQGNPLPHAVVAPAAYPEVIAVGGSIGPVPWEGCFSGPEVDICAPAVEVRAARFLSTGEPRNFNGTGTSFATAIVAGCAALWLQRFGGRQAVADAVPGVPVQQVFRHQLKETAVDPTMFADDPPMGGWNESRFGAGIVNARALVNRSLPAPEDVPPIDEASPFNVYGAASGLAFLDINNAGVLAAINGAVTGMAAAFGAFAGMIGSAVQAVGDFWADMSDAGAGLAAGAAGWIGGLGGAVGLASNIVQANVAAGALADAYAAAASAAGELGDYLEEQAEAAEEALDAAEDAIDEALEEAAEDVEEFVEAAADAAEDAADAATETGAALAGAAASAFSGIFG